MTQLTEQIRQQLVTDILEGRYVPGSAFPTELETAERFRVSRVTVRRAYGALEEAGIIVRRRRVGTVSTTGSRPRPARSGCSARSCRSTTRFPGTS